MLPSRGCGLGSAPGRQIASAGQTRFTQASPVAQPQDMDCSPPMGATVLPPLRQCDSMDTDDPAYEEQEHDSFSATGQYVSKQHPPPVGQHRTSCQSHRQPSLSFLESSPWMSARLLSCQRTSGMSSCTGWMPTRHSAFLREAMPWPGYTLRSLMTSLLSPSHSASMQLSVPLIRLRCRGSRLWILRYAGAALP